MSEERVRKRASRAGGGGRGVTTERRTARAAGAHGLDPLGFLQSKWCDTPEKLQLMKEKEIKHCKRRGQKSPGRGWAVGDGRGWQRKRTRTTGQNRPSGRVTVAWRGGVCPLSHHPGGAGAGQGGRRPAAVPSQSENTHLPLLTLPSHSSPRAGRLAMIAVTGQFFQIAITGHLYPVF